MINHETTYQRITISSIIHRRRLSLIKKIFQNLIPLEVNSWADFGTSSGFLPENILGMDSVNIKEFVGYDHSERLLEIAREKNIQDSVFELFDMNFVQEHSKRFDLVSSFETLEHVGNLDNALINLINHVEDEGYLLITVPNEVKLPGILKFLSRSALRKNAYGDFFTSYTYQEYLKALLQDSDITRFRDPEASGYGPHLGFDYRVMERKLNRLTEGNFELVHKSFSFMKMNFVLLFKKTPTSFRTD